MDRGMKKKSLYVINVQKNEQRNRIFFLDHNSISITEYFNTYFTFANTES